MTNRPRPALTELVAEEDSLSNWRHSRLGRRLSKAGPAPGGGPGTGLVCRSVGDRLARWPVRRFLDALEEAWFR